MLNLGHFPTERLASSSLLGSSDSSVTSVKLTNVKREAPLTVDCRSALHSCKCGKAKEEYCFDSFPLNLHPHLSRVMKGSKHNLTGEQRVVTQSHKMQYLWTFG